MTEQANHVILKRQLLADGFSPEGVPEGDLVEYYITQYFQNRTNKEILKRYPPDTVSG
jgi:hypothetical protein